MGGGGGLGFFGGGVGDAGDEEVEADAGGEEGDVPEVGEFHEDGDGDDGDGDVEEGDAAFEGLAGLEMLLRKFGFG